jgi:hypothetical protein
LHIARHEWQCAKTVVRGIEKFKEGQFEIDGGGKYSVEYKI